MIESESFSDNLIDAASGIKDTTSSFIEDENLEINMNRSSSIVSLEESENLISNLLPVSVLASNENSTIVEMEEEQPAVVISREGKRKQRVSAPATMISHNVRRRKKTASQVVYLRELFHKLGGKWNG